MKSVFRPPRPGLCHQVKRCDLSGYRGFYFLVSFDAHMKVKRVGDVLSLLIGWLVYQKDYIKLGGNIDHGQRENP